LGFKHADNVLMEVVMVMGTWERRYVRVPVVIPTE
jgi:hypothetical protein